MSLFELEPWNYSIFLLLMSGLIIGNNLWSLIRSLLKGESTSFILFIGAFFGGLALIVAPLPQLKWFVFVPILLDPGCAFSLYLYSKG